MDSTEERIVSNDKLTSEMKGSFKVTPRELTTGKDLKKKACRELVCPNIDMIFMDVMCYRLWLDDSANKKAKELLIKYVRKTYDTQHCHDIKHAMTSSLYIASIITNDKRTQREVAVMCETTEVTIRKWSKDMTRVLELDIDEELLKEIKLGFGYRKTSSWEYIKEMLNNITPEMSTKYFEMDIEPLRIYISNKLGINS